MTVVSGAGRTTEEDQRQTDGAATSYVNHARITSRRGSQEGGNTAPNNVVTNATGTSNGPLVLISNTYKHPPSRWRGRYDPLANR
jgi:hypothetical protein